MFNFCTLFDSYYLARGIAMYESLQKYCNSFHLYIFTFDEPSYNYLISRKFKNVTIISLKEFENEKLLSVKDLRTTGEYCWTATGSTIKYCIETYNLGSCTYVDADLYFFSNPKILLDEVKDGSTLITEHRYSKEYDQSKSSGKYCVQFMTFHNNFESMKVLNYWIDECIDWCYAKVENGKFGDQKYLDIWPTKFNKIHELQHLGGGVAPWNVQQYHFVLETEQLKVEKKSNKQKFDLIFYHFHMFKFLGKNKIDLGMYSLNTNVIELIYKPYVHHLLKINKQIENSLYIKKPASEKKKNIFYIFKRLLQEPSEIKRGLKNIFFHKKNIFLINKF